jgi:peroxiredoxin
VSDFRLRDLTRDTPAHVSLSELRGRAVVLYFLSYQ